MLESTRVHNRYQESLQAFEQEDPHLKALFKLKYQYAPDWWQQLTSAEPGIFLLTGGRQIGKTTSCKLLLRDWIKSKTVNAQNALYLPCDEIFDAKQLSQTLRFFLQQCPPGFFLLIIDEITYVPDWDRVIKALADEGVFNEGCCILTGSDTIILKEASMRFPGRRGQATKTDFHLYPLSFKAYVDLVVSHNNPDKKMLSELFDQYLQCGGFLKAINDLADHGKVLESTYLTYEQWIKGDLLRRGKSEENLIAILQALITVGVSQISYSSLTQKIGSLSKETVIDYCRLLERMDVLINLQAYDINKKQGFPRKDRKFHFTDPFIYQVINRLLQRDDIFKTSSTISTIVEACVASHCYRKNRAFYFKGQGEIDVITVVDDMTTAIEVKWAEQLRPQDLKMLKQFKNAVILTKDLSGVVEHIESLPVFDFLYGNSS